jgi:hypothetical protein
MATYASLTSEQKAAVDELANNVRVFAGELAQLCNHGRAAASKWAGNVENIVGSLTNGTTIPNNSGLNEGQSLTKEQLTNLVGYLMTLSETADNGGGYNTNYHRSLYVAAAGMLSTIG